MSAAASASEPIRQGNLESELKELGDCSICLEVLESGQEKTRFSCAHTFHKDCIDRWFDTCRVGGHSQTCPNCRQAPGPEYEVQGNSGIQGCRALCACVLFSSAWIVCFLYFFMKGD